MTVKGFGNRMIYGFGGLSLAIAATVSQLPPQQAAQAQNANALTVRSDIQEANTETGIITARGNVRINYPARNLQATAAQAQYFSEERTLVLSGNVYVFQDGNSLRAEQMTYSIDEGRFVATPGRSEQVEASYLIPEQPPTSQSRTPAPITLPEDE
ncbi:LptA/OstA family protein [Picosynechococcus sp. PCC 8807]|uniref:LptA/OstA family protein n=1 Tax=Picosynechococcus sp. PCC 8807 TaxID=195248 RepID=UPI000810D9B6|nr:LptA/OstA family protein [Picosynechococcus sp. PCC 8807]ANV89853.1 OstA family protein [Picosynechococcus sp. PCC 8807]